MTVRPALFVVALTLFTNAAPRQQPTVARLDVTPLLHQVVFSTPDGEVRVTLPRDAAAGDRIGGAVTRDPSGADDVERARHAGALGRYTVQVPSVSSGALTTAFSLTLPPDASERSQVVTLQAPNGTTTTWTGTLAIPVLADPLPTLADAPLPTLAQAGRALPVLGAFDGRPSNTRVSVGGRDVQVIAESPRRTIVTVPDGVSGVTALRVADGDAGRSGTLRVVSVDLQVGKTNLTRGETTPLTAVLTGLQQLTDTLPLDFLATGVVLADGGNRQHIVVTPAAVDAQGRFTTTRILTAQRTGDFDVTVSVLLPLPCALLNQTVHVEGDLAGSTTTGIWSVKVKYVKGKPFHVRVKSATKPPLRECQWIVIAGCGSTDDGDPVIEKYTFTTDPTKRPLPPKKDAAPGTGAAAGGATPPAPEAAKPPAPDTKAEPPCVEGEERNPSTAETREFKVAAAWSKPELRLSTNLDGATSAAENMAEFWKTVFDLGGLAKKLVPRVPGKTPIGLLLEYLNQGSTVLLAVKSSKLSNNLDTVSLTVTMETITYKVTKWTVEVCHGGGWVREVRCSRAKGEPSVLSAGVTIVRGSRDWETIEDPDNPRLVSRERLEAWAKDWFSRQLQQVEDDAEKLKEFTKDCPP